MQKTVYAKYTRTRDPRFQTATRILEEDGRYIVEKKALTKQAQTHIASFRENYEKLQTLYRDIRPCGAEIRNDTVRFDYLQGRTVSGLIEEDLTDLKTVLERIRQYLDLVLNYREEKLCVFSTGELFEKIFGRRPELKGSQAVDGADIDAIFDNFILTEDGIYATDYEWYFDFPIPRDFIKYRILTQFYYKNHSFFVDRIPLTDYWSLFGLADPYTAVFRQMEEDFQQYVYGPDRIYQYLLRYKQPDQDVQNSLNRSNEWKDKYNQVINSASWKITRPVRSILDQLHKFTGQGGNAGIQETARRIKNKLRRRKVQICTGEPAPGTAAGDIRGVTAVVPNYNYERFLDERIDSILWQTYPVSEIILLDDCSTDRSVERMEQRIRENTGGIPMRLIRNEKNSGNVFAQWQKAFQLAAGEFVWIAEADDSCNERFLETVMRSFEDDEVILSYCESLTMDENGYLLMEDLREWIDIFHCGKWDQSYVNDGRREVAETMCINNTIANVSGAVIRNGDYDEILEQAKEYRLAGDWYTYMNFLKRGKIAYHRESLNYHRMQNQGVTLSVSHEKEFEEIVRLQDYALRNFNVPDEVRKKVFERRERVRARFGL